MEERYKTTLISHITDFSESSTHLGITHPKLIWNNSIGSAMNSEIICGTASSTTTSRTCTAMAAPSTEPDWIQWQSLARERTLSLQWKLIEDRQIPTWTQTVPICEWPTPHHVKPLAQSRTCPHLPDQTQHLWVEAKHRELDYVHSCTFDFHMHHL